MRKEKGYSIDENEIEHYYKKLQSIATNLSGEMKITNASAKEVIKKYISSLPYRDRYNLLDVLDYMESKKKGANCLGKCVLFATLAEMLDSELFSNLRHVVTPGHSFIRIKGQPDLDIETTLNYEKMEIESKGEGAEQDLETLIDYLWISYGKEKEAKKLRDNLLSFLYKLLERK